MQKDTEGNVEEVRRIPPRILNHAVKWRQEDWASEEIIEFTDRLSENETEVAVTRTFAENYGLHPEDISTLVNFLIADTFHKYDLHKAATGTVAQTKDQFIYFMATAALGGAFVSSGFRKVLGNEEGQRALEELLKRVVDILWENL